MTDQIQYRDPTELRLHPLLKQLPEPGKAEWDSFVEALVESGPEQLEPITVCGRDVVSGDRRWRAAKDLQWGCIPVIERPEHEAAILIVEGLLTERSLTKGARFLLAMEMAGEYTRAINQRCIFWYQKGEKNRGKPLKLAKVVGSNAVGTDEISLHQLAARWGASDEHLYRCARILKAFDLPDKFEFQKGAEKTLREYFRPLITDPLHPIGLGEALKGIGWFVDANGKPKHHGAPPARNSLAHRLQVKFNGLSKAFCGWEKIPEREREACAETLQTAVAAWPDEMLDTLSNAARAERRRRSNQP